MAKENTKESDLKLFIDRTAWQKICGYVDLCDTEISGLGRVEEMGDNFIVRDVAILEQEVSGAHATMEAKALANFQEEMVRAGKSLKGWVFWWHSHVNMQAYFSGTDTGTMDTSTDFPYLISLVTNKRRDVQARIDIHKPARLYAEMEVQVLDDKNDAIIEECRAEIALKIKKPIYQGGGWKEGGHHYHDGKYSGNSSKEMGFSLAPVDAKEGDRWGAYVKKGHIWIREYPAVPDVPERDEHVGEANEADMVLEFEASFWVEIKDLCEQINFLERQNGKKARKALKKRQRQLEELVDYGQEQGIVVSDQLIKGIMDREYGD